MSEFSESFHFRDTSRTAIAVLKRSTLRGLAFPPRNGWRTFVPFDREQAVGAVLSQMLAAPVLHYVYAEDHGWGFEIWQAGTRASAYWCSWPTDDLEVDESALRLEALDALSPEGASVGAVLDLLRARSAEWVPDQNPAYRFARILRLAWFEWVGPETVEADIGVLSRKRGFSIIGTPPSKPTFDAPTISRLLLPSTAISAAEAVAILRPQVSQWASDAAVAGLSSYGAVMEKDERHLKGPWISERGRTTPHGGWRVGFTSAERELWTWVQLFATGEVETEAGPLRVNSSPSALPERWVDTPDVIAITEPLFDKAKAETTPALRDRVMRLDARDGVAVWNVNYMCAGKTRVDFHFLVDGRVGHVLEQRQLRWP
jgi:hypothetical protein